MHRGWHALCYNGLEAATIAPTKSASEEIPLNREPTSIPPPSASLRRAGSLRTRISLVLTAVLAALLLSGASVWVHLTRLAIHEEIESATRVAEQWLNVLIPETLDGLDGMDRLMTHLEAVGRIRANRLEVLDAQGRLLYVSPEPTYKAGRSAPSLFAAHVGPEVRTRSFPAADRTIVLRPDTSRSVLDAWDELTAASLWAMLLLVLVLVGSRLALHRALAPLSEIDHALARSADGHFETRLPLYRVAELDRLAMSYNRLADSLDESLDENRRLEHDRMVTHAVQTRLEEERKLIARELHDELGQGITAVRAIAGAMLQRSQSQPQLHGSAQAILAMTSQMQDGVRTILERLREPDKAPLSQLDEVVRNYCALWSRCHPAIELVDTIASGDVPVPNLTALTILRLLQESLTNVARHAQATRVEITLQTRDGCILLEVRDNGRGLPPALRSNRFGIVGMHERVAGLRGELRLDTPNGGGLRVSATLPIRNEEENDHGARA